MSTTWNSRVDALRPFAAVMGLLAACASGQGTAAPDSPRPARDVSGIMPQVSVTSPRPTADTTVELRSARVLPVRGDSALMRMAGAELLARARDPVAIEVTTVAPLGDVARDAAVVVVIDDQRIDQTWPLPPNRLMAFLPDRTGLRVGSVLVVEWLGRAEVTRTRRPLVFTENRTWQLR